MIHSIRQYRRALLAVAATAALAVGLGAATRPVQAATPLWTTTKDIDGHDYPEPLDADTNLPAYVPFDQAMDTTGIAGTSSVLLKNATGNNVAVQLTHQTGQSGSIWSTAPLSLQQSFATKMHIYFGARADSADGMAFVLAGQRPTAVGNQGGSLGVWNVKSGNALSGALKKSFALAFDTYNNGHTEDTDVNVRVSTYVDNAGGQYVGWGFPDMAYQYKSRASQTLQFDTLNRADGGINKQTDGAAFPDQRGLGGYQIMTKDSGEKFTDGKWHAVSVNWTADASKDGGGTLTFSVAISQSHVFTKSLTWTAKDVTTIFGGTNLYWGFAGSTGKSFEEGVVAFETIPGLVDGGLNAAVTGASGAVHLGDRLKQTYTLTYNGAGSRQDWPLASTTGTAGLTATMRTGDHYGFAVGADDRVAVTLTAPDGTTKQVAGECVGPIQTVTDLYGNAYRIATQVTVANLPRFERQKGAGQRATLTAPLIATSLGAAETGVGAGAVVGGNARYSATVAVPAVVANPLSISGADFHFGTLTVAQIIKGFTGAPGTVGTAGAHTGIVPVFPSDAAATLTATMAPMAFPANTGYQPGGTRIAFTYNGRSVTLADDGQPVTLFAGATAAPPAAVTAATLAMAAYPRIQAGHYSTAITWTLAVTPIVP
ncbi:lectin-like domain-containing protein [Lacticaseibacillus kribbianus]|uniref:lectin-like domain-containing protein n=1 Tax=Lacticaseibacillus kribbianus TaxID=2926292 RepID=UPI001CD4C59F|nr:hypothetical protein [Lacticaseibacillus kribbianus]